MSLFENFDIRDVAKILKQSDPNNQEPNSDDEIDNSPNNSTGAFLSPSDIGNKREVHKISESTSTISSKTKIADNKDSIWSNAELELKDDIDSAVPDVSNDPRKIPTYEMYFQQSVSTEDVFLQMGHKTPATSSCENLIVKVHLPDEDHNMMQLDLKHQRIELRSPFYILILSLPHPIDPNAGNASWDKEKEILKLTLKMKRDFDQFNF